MVIGLAYNGTQNFVKIGKIIRELKWRKYNHTNTAWRSHLHFFLLYLFLSILLLVS
jgi:hypothetical protein